MTDCPYVDGLSDEVMAEVVVEAWLTVCVKAAGAELPMKFAFPAYTAEMVSVPAGVVFVVNAATPDELTLAVPSVVAPFLKVTVPTGTAAVADVTATE